MGHFYWARTSDHRWETAVGSITLAIVRISEKNWKGSVTRGKRKQPYKDATPNFNKRSEAADALLQMIGHSSPAFHTFGAANKTPFDEASAAAAAGLKAEPTTIITGSDTGPMKVEEATLVTDPKREQRSRIVRRGGYKAPCRPRANANVG